MVVQDQYGCDSKIQLVSHHDFVGFVVVVVLWELHFNEETESFSLSVK